MSKDRLLLVGAGGFGRVVSELARQSFDCAFVDDGVEVGTIICDIPVIGQTADLHNLFAEYKNLVIVIGNNSVRERIYNMTKRIGYNFPNLISSSAYISSYAKLGWGCVILNNAVIQNGSCVGNGVLLNPGVEVHHDCSIGDYEAIEAVKEARAQGDLSENFEYYAAKRDKNKNESRIRYLERMIKNAEIITDNSRDDEVGLNNTVQLYMEEDDETETYKLVTSIRGNSLSGRISTESPLGKAILGHKVGDRVAVKVSDDYTYYVVIRSIENTEDDGSDAIRGF